MAFCLACPVHIYEVIQDIIVKGGIIEDRGENELICSPAVFKEADHPGVLFEEAEDISRGGAGDREPVGPSYDRIVQGEFPFGEEFIQEHLEAEFAGDAPVDEVVLFYAVGGFFPFMIDGFAGNKFFSLQVMDILIDRCRRPEGKVLCGDHVDIIVSFGKDLCEAVEGGLDRSVPGPIDLCPLTYNKNILFFGKWCEGGCVGFPVDMQVEVECRVVQGVEEPL